MTKAVRRMALAVACGVGLLAHQSHAATYYWDTNGTDAGFGTASGTWGTSEFWSTSSAGTAVPTNATTANTNDTTDALQFGAGANGLATGTITVDGTRNAGSLLFASASGTITLSGGAIALPSGGPGQLTTPNVTVNSTRAIIDSVVAQSNLNKAGTGTLVLTGANTYARTIIHQGIVEVPTISDAGAPSTLGNTSNNPVNFQIVAGSGANRAELVYTGGSPGSTNRGIALVGDSAGITGAIGVVAGSSLTISGQVRNLTAAIGGGSNGLGSGTAGLEVNRDASTTGTLILTGDSNDYVGGTTITHGTLLANNTSGSATGTGAITINGGTFGGTGSVSGGITLNAGGTISPGASIESLATGSNTWNGGGSFDFEFSTDGSTGTAGSQWDLLAITGGLDLFGADSLNQVTLNLFTMSDATTPGVLASWDPDTDHLWSGFVTTTTGITGFDADKFTIDVTGFQNSLSGTFHVVQNGNNLDLAYVAVPEPSMIVVALSGGVAGLVMLRRRRTARSACC